MERGGFEPPTPSWRKMHSDRCDLGKRLALRVLWSGCGANDDHDWSTAETGVAHLVSSHEATTSRRIGGEGRGIGFRSVEADEVEGLV